MEKWERLDRIPAPHFIPVFGPLSGLRVLMAGSIVAGPFGAQLAADFGAEVIHIELPQIGDTYRTQKPQILSEDGLRGMSAAYCQKRNKLSFSLNTNLRRHPEAREIFFSLIKQTDVFVENMVWLDKLGINSHELLKINPKLIIIHVSGYGRPQFGGNPAICDRPSYDIVGLCEGGLMNMCGEPDGPPMYAQPFTNDYLTGTFTFGAICAGYCHILKGGMGQEIDIAQVETAARVLDDHWASYINLGVEKNRVGNKVPIFQPASLHKCKDERYAFIGAFGEAAYYRAIDGLGLSRDEYGWEECGRSKEAVDSEKGQELYKKIDEWFAERTAQEAQDHMDKFKTPVAIVKAPKDIYPDQHWHDRNNFIKYQVPAIDREIEAFGFVPKFMETPGQVWRGQVDVGYDTERIMKELLNYSDGEIDSIKGRGIID